jgi:phospholipid-translocating ATPase
MGVKPATDIFQERMGMLFLDMDVVVVFMDDTIIFGYAGFGEHLLDVAEVLKRLQEAGFQVNPEKCIWFASSVNYLGFTITREGIKPQETKIQGILNMAQPRNQKDVRRFVGMVNFYRDLYPNRAATLAPLTDLCGKNKKFIWTSVQEEAFSKMKEIMGRETMLTYPQFDKPFVIYTDASEKQIGGIVTQEQKPLGFFSKKLTETQQKYPVTEQELLAIVETIKYFRHMLLGHKIVVKTDHKNLTHPFSNHTSNRVLRQRLLLEEYGVELEYIRGEQNVAADALSRLPSGNETEIQHLAGLLSALPAEELFAFDADNDFPLNTALIAKYQRDDAQLKQALQKSEPDYRLEKRNDEKLYVHREHASIYIPALLRNSVLQWYHTSLQHPGIKRMQATMKENVHWPGLDAAVARAVKNCPVCQHSTK